MTYLLDTCIVADLLSPTPDPRLFSWVDSQPEEMLFISVITLAELKQIIESEKSSKTRVRMNNWLINDFLARFNGRINEITTEVTLKWGEIIARIHSQERPISPIDSLTLAIAITHNHSLVTHNPGAFEWSGVNLLDPCSDESNH